MANPATPSRSSLNPATSVPKPKGCKPKERKSFWSQNINEIDSIGWSRRYALSDSDDGDEKSESDQESDDEEDDTFIANDEDNANIDTPSESDNSITNRNTISIATIIDQEPNLPANSTAPECHCHHVLKRQIDSYDPDVRQQILLEVYDWLNGGEHSRSSLSASAFASSSSTDSGNDNGNGNGSVGKDGVTLTEQQRDSYYHLINPQDYWTEVNWAGDREASNNEAAITVDTQPNNDQDWEDMGLNLLNIDPGAEVELLLIWVVVVVLAHWLLVGFAERVMGLWLDVGR